MIFKKKKQNQKEKEKGKGKEKDKEKEKDISAKVNFSKRTLVTSSASSSDSGVATWPCIPQYHDAAAAWIAPPIGYLSGRLNRQDVIRNARTSAPCWYGRGGILEKQCRGG